MLVDLGDPLPDWSRGLMVPEGVSLWKKIELNYYLMCLTIFRGVLQFGGQI